MLDTNELVIDTQNLGKKYKETRALHQLNLKVPKHTIFGFLGPNGAGKTTTIKLLLGLAKPTSGSARVFGMDIEKQSVEIRRRVGYLAQDPRYYEYMTARQTLRFTTGFFYEGPRKAIEDRIQETLELVELEDKADRPVKGLSGGERQRLGIAQAQVNYPDLLILDEPAASLDPEGRRDTLELMRRLRKHTTIFYSTHILDDVQRVSDMVAILNKGELVAQASIEELLAGTGGVVYRVTLLGDGKQAQTRVGKNDWVSGVTAKAGKLRGSEGITTLNVSVKDEKKAEALLLRQVLEDAKATVVEFGRARYELEEVFLNIVEGSSHEHKK